MAARRRLGTTHHTDQGLNDPSSLAHSALAYTARGWAVIPLHTMRADRCSCRRDDCPSPGKHPRVRWQRFERVCPTAAQVAAWWRRWPDANVGVVTGKASGAVVLDIDPRNGGDISIASLEERWGGRPETVESITGGGGQHLWFAAVDALPSVPIAPGCDLKGEGGLVVAPPSVHRCGATYAWRPGHAPDEIELARLPEWLRAVAPREIADGAPASQVTIRTPGEQAEFAATWLRGDVALRPGDHNYVCPFHDDHHPSLHIDAEGCRWICFGCGLRGGIGALRRALHEIGLGRLSSRIRELPEVDSASVTMHGNVEVDVVGESFHQDALLRLTGGRRSYGGVDACTVATLTADSAAPLDPDAVEVRIADCVIGRLRPDVARRYRTLIAFTARERGVVSCVARIVGGWDRGRQDVGAFGVRLLLPQLDDVPLESP
jgi:hypothetical protein